MFPQLRRLVRGFVVQVNSKDDSISDWDTSLGPHGAAERLLL